MLFPKYTPFIHCWPGKGERCFHIIIHCTELVSFSKQGLQSSSVKGFYGDIGWYAELRRAERWQRAECGGGWRDKEKHTREQAQEQITKLQEKQPKYWAAREPILHQQAELSGEESLEEQGSYTVVEEQFEDRCGDRPGYVLWIQQQ